MAASLLALPVSAQAESLSQLVEKALLQDASYAAARENWLASQQLLPQAQSALKPRAELSASAYQNHLDSDEIPGAQDYPSANLQLTLRQPLYRKQNDIALQQAELQVAQAEVALAQARQSLILRVAQAYVDLLDENANAELLAAQLEASSASMAQAQRRYDLGSNTLTDIEEARSRLDLIKARVIATNNNVQLRRRALTAILGSPAADVDSLSLALPAQTLAFSDLDLWIEKSRQGNPQLRIQQIASRLARREIRRQESLDNATLDLVFSHQLDTSDGEQAYGLGNDSNASRIGLQLNIPLYTGGGSAALQREAGYRANAASFEEENACRLAEFDTSQAFLSLVNGIAQMEALKQAVRSSESSLQASLRGWELGTRTTADLLDAQQQLYSAQRDLNQARYQVMMNRLRLYASVGELDDDKLLQI